MVGTGNGPLANLKFYGALVEDLQAAKGKSIVIAGEDQSPEVHAVVHYINQVLGNNGTTVVSTQLARSVKPADQWARIWTALLADLHGGQVDLLLISGRQSVYSAPPELNLRGRDPDGENAGSPRRARGRNWKFASG